VDEDHRSDTTSSSEETGTHGYPKGTPGYPNGENEDGARGADDPSDAGVAASDPSGGIDLDRFLPPREAVKLFTSDQPIAHDGKAGWAVERATQRAIWLSGTPQYDVMTRSPGAPRDEPGLSDFPAHGGLPESAPSEAAIRKEANEAARKRVQIGLKLSPAEASELEEAADAFGVTRTTLARMLVVRGAREIVARARDSGA
jgi:hypothetical protein